MRCPNCHQCAELKELTSGLQYWACTNPECKAKGAIAFVDPSLALFA